MAKASDNLFPKLKLGAAGAVPAAPSDASWTMYSLADGIYARSSNTSVGPFSTFAGVRVYHSTTQAIGTGAYASINFNSEQFDTSGFHSVLTNTSRLTVPAGLAGYYVIGGTVGMAPNATGTRAARIYLNNTTRIAESTSVLNPSGSVTARMQVHTAYFLSATDYVELQVFQDSGGNLDSQALTNSTPVFWMYRVG